MKRQNRTIAVVAGALAGGAVAFVVLELSGIGWFGIGLFLGAVVGGWLARLLIPLKDDRGRRPAWASATSPIAPTRLPAACR